ncbi:MAG: hypothetical protein WCT42_02685 [Candidatus Paceibacterota bacterium]|jgi:hypothetical protein
MLDKVLLNWEPYTLKEDNLPCLITYGKHMGGSHLSIVLIANLFLQGSKILFLTAYPMARDNFLNQIEEDTSRVAFVDSLESLEESLDKDAIIIESGNATLFLNAIKLIPDLDERVIFVKNIEIFNEEIFNTCLENQKVILSGDIDECNFKNNISIEKFYTIIAFNQPETPIRIEIPKLEMWSSYLKNDKQSGILTLHDEQNRRTP